MEETTLHAIVAIAKRPTVRVFPVGQFDAHGRSRSGGIKQAPQQVALAENLLPMQ